jgi:hypothetical protein
MTLVVLVVLILNVVDKFLTFLICGLLVLVVQFLCLCEFLHVRQAYRLGQTPSLVLRGALERIDDRKKGSKARRTGNWWCCRWRWSLRGVSSACRSAENMTA